MFGIKDKSSSSGHTSMCWDRNGVLHIIQYTEMILIYGDCQRRERLQGLMPNYGSTSNASNYSYCTLPYAHKQTDNIERSSDIGESAKNALLQIHISARRKYPRHIECGYTRQHVCLLLLAHGAHEYFPVLLHGLMLADQEQPFKNCNSMLKTFQERPTLLTFCRQLGENSHGMASWTCTVCIIEPWITCTSASQHDTRNGGQWTCGAIYGEHRLLNQSSTTGP